jgi:hypothetical protein
MRNVMRRTLVNMLHERCTVEDQRCRITHLAENLEAHLYNHATSMDMYSDWLTLTPRIQLLGMKPDHPLLQSLIILKQLLHAREADCSIHPELAAAQKMWLHVSTCSTRACNVPHCNHTRSVLIHCCACEKECDVCDLAYYYIPSMKPLLQNLKTKKLLKQRVISENEAAQALINLRPVL